MARILVVDDEKVMVKGIRFNLENEGYTVDVGVQWRQAVELARANEYDLIILDLMMPKIDGLQACMEIRAFSTVPIIMLTARGRTRTSFWGLSTGRMTTSQSPLIFWRLRPGSRRCCAGPPPPGGRRARTSG